MKGAWELLLRHLGNLLLSFVLALMVWVVAELQNDPNISQLYPFPVPLEVVGKDPNLLLTSPLPSEVRVQLRAPRSVWDRILAEQGVEAQLDLSGLRPGTYIVPVRIIVRAAPVRVEDFQPQAVEITLEEVLTRRVPVTIEVQGEPAVGYEFGPLQVFPSQVNVQGPRSTVEQVRSVRARLIVQDLRSTLERWLTVRPYDAQGQVVEGVTLQPEQVRVVLPVRQLGGYRDVSVRVVIQGQPATGYLVANIAVFPPVVTLFSPDPTKVLEIPGFVETEPVDIAGATEDLELRVPLNVPEGVQVVGEDRVLVQIIIQPVKSSLTVQLPVEVVGLPPGWQAEVAPDIVDVILFGPLVELKKVKPQETVRAFVSVDGLEPGTYTLEVQVEVLLEDVQVTSALPNQVEVILEAATPTPTSTPTESAVP